MPKAISGVEPVAIALENIDASGDVRLNGIDLETGARVSVVIERCARDRSVAAGATAADGLVLLLTISQL